MTKDDSREAAKWWENQLLLPKLSETAISSLRIRIKHLDAALANPLLKEVPVSYKAIKKKRAELAASLKAQGVKP